MSAPTRRSVTAGLAMMPTAIAASPHVWAAPLDATAQLELIAFGSCNNQRLPQIQWAPMLAKTPQLLLMMGDNVYGDLDAAGPEHLAVAYGELARSEAFQDFASRVPILATWDDHDFGANDRSKTYEHRRDAQQQFLSFWEADAQDVRWRRDGVYHSRLFGPEGRRVQVIMLDLRTFRSEMTRGYDLHRNAPGYAPQLDASAQMLGEDQWRWLENQLRQPAEVRLLVSSLQLIGDGGENWKHLPLERRRLFDLITATEAQGVMVLSGDVHTGAFYRFNRNTPYPLYEFTSSSLNQGRRGVVMEEPYLIEGGVYQDSNFGMVAIDWERGQITVRLHSLDGAVVRSRTVQLDELRPA